MWWIRAIPTARWRSEAGPGTARSRESQLLLELSEQISTLTSVHSDGDAVNRWTGMGMGEGVLEVGLRGLKWERRGNGTVWNICSIAATVGV
jgi:hypothetical protein